MTTGQKIQEAKRKRGKMKKLIYLLGVAMLLSGCATTGTLDDTWKKTPARLKSDILNYSFEQTYDAAKMSILNLGLAFDSEGKIDSTTVLYAKSAANMASVIWMDSGYGEMVGIYLTPLSANQTKVEVAIQKNDRLGVGYKDYRGLILNQIKTILELKK